MLLKNFYKWMESHGKQETKTYTRSDGASVTVKYSDITSTSFGAPFEIMSTRTRSSVSGTEGYCYAGTWFGSGTTPPTRDDFSLENIITEGVTISHPSAVSVTETDDYVEYSVTFGVTATETVTISEVGLFMSNYVMVERTVLETPITIPAGQSKQVTYTIRMNYPTA
jgi:hypothetical protein